jgi:hypothetical protein
VSLLVGEALVLPLGMWRECFAHTRGGAGTVLGGRGAAGRRSASPPRRPAGRRCRAIRCLGGRATGVGGGGWRDARRAPHPARPGSARPPPALARRGMAGGAARPPCPSPLAGAVPLCPRARSSPVPQQGREGGEDRGGGGEGRQKDHSYFLIKSI